MASLGSVDKKTGHLALKSSELSPSSLMLTTLPGDSFGDWFTCPKGAKLSKAQALSLSSTLFPTLILHPGARGSGLTLNIPLWNHSWDLRPGWVGCPYYTITLTVRWWVSVVCLPGRQDGFFTSVSLASCVHLKKKTLLIGSVLLFP